MGSNQVPISFIAIVDFTEHVRWIYCSPSVADLLGYEPHELHGKSALDLAHPDEIPPLKSIHFSTIMGDKAATLLYMRFRHKDPLKGYILCAVTRTVAHDVLVGSIAFAVPGAKAMQNNATASEVDVITPSARGDFEFRRWNDPDPMNQPVPDSPTSSSQAPDSSPPPMPSPQLAPAGMRSLLNPDPSSPGASSNGPTLDGATRSPTNSRSPAPLPTPALSTPSPTDQPVLSIEPTTSHPTFAPLPSQSKRTALILERYSSKCPIIYVSNDNLMSTTSALGRPFYDYVTRRDEPLVRSWIDQVKSWSINERGPPSDGGFGFGTFALCKSGRDSREAGDAPASRNRSRKRRDSNAGRPDRRRGRDGAERETLRLSDEVMVNAIFSPQTDGILVVLRPAPRRSPIEEEK